MDFIDLHTHSTASDGTVSPTQLAHMAADVNLKAIALTDHDTVGGLEEFMAATAELSIEGIPGMETTIVVDDCDLHLICLYIDPGHPEMAKSIRSLAQSRTDRNAEMIKRLADIGIDISLEDFSQYGDRAISRGHVAKLLVERGHAKTPKQAITEYLVKGSPGYVRRVTPDPAKFIRTVHNSGGLCFVAHLHQIDPQSPQHCIDICHRMIDLGADGLETLYCEYDKSWREITEKIARDRGVLRSGGSDFHGDIKPGLELKVGYGELEVPYEFLSEIKRKL